MIGAPIYNISKILIIKLKYYRSMLNYLLIYDINEAETRADNISNLFRKELDMSESKREKFVRLAEARTNRIIDTLQLLGNLSNTSAYEYSKKDIDQMFKAIEDAMADTRNKFNKADVREKKKFSFKD